MAGRSLLSKRPSLSPTSLFAARSAYNAVSSRSLPSPLRRLCPFFPLYESRRSPIVGAGIRCLSTLPKTPSPLPHWRSMPMKEIPAGCDFKHWIVCMETPNPKLTRDEIIDSYIKTLAQVVGSEEEARMKIYYVSTKYYFSFGVLLSEELTCKIEGLPNVIQIFPDCYVDVENQDYGGEPFVDGQAVPYHQKYHEEWIDPKKKPYCVGAKLQIITIFPKVRPSNSSNAQNAPPMPNRDYQGWDIRGRDQ